MPTECTRVALRIVDGSIAAFTPNYPGCLVVHLGDLEFGTTLIGGSPDVAFRVSIPSLSLLLIDNKAEIQLPGSGSSRTGSNYWKASPVYSCWIFILTLQCAETRLRFVGRIIRFLIGVSG